MNNIGNHKLGGVFKNRRTNNDIDLQHDSLNLDGLASISLPSDLPSKQAAMGKNDEDDVPVLNDIDTVLSSTSSGPSPDISNQLLEAWLEKKLSNQLDLLLNQAKARLRKELIESAQSDLIPQLKSMTKNR